MFSIEYYKNRLDAIAETEVEGSFTFGYLEEFEKLTSDRYPAVVAIYPEWQITEADRELQIQQKIFFGKEKVSNYEAELDNLLGLAKDYIDMLNDEIYMSVPNINDRIPVGLIPKGQTADGSVWIVVNLKIDMFCEPS